MDAISNMIIALKNAGNSGRENVTIPYSHLKEEIAKVLEKEGFIKSFEKKSHKGKPALSMELRFEDTKLDTGRLAPKIKGTQRISKTSRRIYKKHNELRPVKNGYGLLVISTPQGVMSGREAKKAHVGGEVLFSIW